jgi:hypothetical protein
MPPDVDAALDRYLARGKGLLVMTKTGILPNGAFVDDGMVALCKKLNVELTNDVVLRFSKANWLDVFEVKTRVPERTNNRLAQQFQTKTFPMIAARTVRPGKGAGQFQAEMILEATPQDNRGRIWAETTGIKEMIKSPVAYVDFLAKRGLLQDKLSDEPLPVAVAVTDENGRRPRAIVLGDDYLITTSAFITNEPGQTTNYEFFRSCLEWLAGRETPMLGIPARDAKTYLLADNRSDFWMTWFPLFFMALALAGSGAGIWIVRRK